MNSLEYENYMETKAHVDPLFPYNTYHWTSMLSHFTGIPIWRSYISKRGKEM